MMSFSLSGGVEVVGFISPTTPLDTYPVIDTFYGIDGLRNVNTVNDLNNIPELRRRPGMLAGVSGGTEYYKLNPSPWDYTINDWTKLNLDGSSFTGFTISDGVNNETISNGDTVLFTTNSGLTTTVLSIDTIFLDYNLTGMTEDLNPMTGDKLLIFDSTTNEHRIIDWNQLPGASGGEVNTASNVGSGQGLFKQKIGTDLEFYSLSGGSNTTLSLVGNVVRVDVTIPPDTNTYVTGGTYNDVTDTITLTRNDGGTVEITGVTDTFTTGGTYSNGVATFTNNSGTTFTVTGFTEPFSGGSGNCITDFYVTNIHGCSPITIHDSVRSDNSIVLDDSYSYAFGDNVVSTGGTSHAEGRETKAIGEYSHAEGWGNIASGSASHAEGGDSGEGPAPNTASGISSHAEGADTIASGRWSHAEGFSTTASDDYAHAEGRSSTASGFVSHAEGRSTTASGTYSHAEGRNTTASGESSHAEGESTTASGLTSHAEGYLTIAGGENSHAQNNRTEAIGSNTHAGGQGGSSTEKVIAKGDVSFVHFYNNSGSNKGAYGDHSAILGGQNHNIGTGSTSSGIFVGDNSVINDDILRSVVLGGQGLTATTSDTVFVPALNINSIGAGSPVINLGLDVNGFVVTGATSPQDVFVYSGNANVTTSELTFLNTTGGTFTVTNSAALFADNDINVTGGTYNPSTGCVTFTTNSGTTFDVCGFLTGLTDTFVTGTTFSSNEATLTRNDGFDVFKLSGGSGVTLSNPSTNQILIDVTIPPTTNTYVTGGTYNTGTTSVDYVGTVGFPPFSVDLSELVSGITISGTTIKEIFLNDEEFSVNTAGRSVLLSTSTGFLSFAGTGQPDDAGVSFKIPLDYNSEPQFAVQWSMDGTSSTANTVNYNLNITTGNTSTINEHSVISETLSIVDEAYSGTAWRILQTPFSSSTINYSPGDYIHVELQRDPGNVNDTMIETAFVSGLIFKYKANK